MTYPDSHIERSEDPLGETLHLLRLTGTLYCRPELTAPWGVDIPALDGLMTFQVVTQGRCWLEVEGGPSRLLQPGSLTLFPHGTAHSILSEPGVRREPLFDIPVEKISERYEIMRYGGGGEETRLTYGVMRFDHVAARRLIALLPQIIEINTFDQNAGNWLQSTLRFIIDEARSLRPGGETVITRLSDILVIQAIRTWLDTAPEARQGWLAALRDPQLGQALGALHRAPDKPWTVASLARQAGMSRSVFSSRFSKLVGDTPMHYLTWWRMQLARAYLQQESVPLADIAGRLGYLSEAAFCRAFKRLFGETPGSVRQGQSTTMP